MCNMNTIKVASIKGASASMLIFVLLLVSDFIVPSHAQYFSLGFCPRVGGMKDFNITRYEGDWYEVEKFWFVFEATASCTKVRYFDNKDGTFAVEISMLEGISRTRSVMPGRTWYRSRDKSADFMLDLIITQSPLQFPFRYPYLLLNTDYENYSIKFRCNQLGPISMQNLWILSRTKILSPESRNEVYNYLRRIGINTAKLRRSNLSTCPDIE